MIFFDLIVDPNETVKDQVGDPDLWDLDCNVFTDYYEDEDKHLKYGVKMFARFNIFTVWIAPRSDFRVRENLEVYLMHVRYKVDNQ